MYPDLRLFWDGFCALNAARQCGWSEQPITVGEVRDYCDLAEIRGRRTRLTMLHAVQVLDAEWLTLVREEKPKKRGQGR